MTPCQKIKRDILLAVLGNKEYLDKDEDEEKEFILSLEAGITAETVNNQYDTLIDLGMHGDYEYEFRGGTVETKLPCDYSRHYEAKSVARKLTDGSWVGWTFWYGGGKHGNPEEIEWMRDAYNLEVIETEKLVVLQEFKKV